MSNTAFKLANMNQVESLKNKTSKKVRKNIYFKLPSKQTREANFVRHIAHNLQAKRLRERITST